jgi:hypothetical protein
MQKATIEESQTATHREAEKLREEVVILTGQHAALAQQSRRASTLMQKLGKTYGFGVAGKLEWADFKLRFKQEQLTDCEQRTDSAKLPGNLPSLHLVAPVRETAQQRMERMISENPLELEPHIRRAYQPLIAAEQ